MTSLYGIHFQLDETKMTQFEDITINYHVNPFLLFVSSRPQYQGELRSFTQKGPLWLCCTNNFLKGSCEILETDLLWHEEHCSMIFFASFPRKLGQKVAKKAHKEIFMSKKRASKDTANYAGKKIKILATKQYFPLYGKPFYASVKQGAYSRRCRSPLCKF